MTGRPLEKIMTSIADDPTILNKLIISADKVVPIEMHAKLIHSIYEEVIANVKSARPQ